MTAAEEQGKNYAQEEERNSLDPLIARLRTNLLKNGKPIQNLKEATEQNVKKTMQHIQNLSDSLQGFRIEGGIYDVTTGEVRIL